MILCFSGTGNSLAVANHIAQLAGDKVYSLGEPLHLLPDVKPGEQVIWVMPCHSWGMPKWVKKNLRTTPLPGAEAANHHLVMTCGDDIGLAHLQWRKALAKRGWKTVGTYSVAMPNTYILLPGFDVDSLEVSAARMESMPQRVARIWHSIKCGARVDDVVRGGAPWLKTKVVYPLFMLLLTSPKPFHSTTTCVGCAKCAKACPLSNISMAGNHPQWGKQCTLCLGCYHACPVHAVAYGSITTHKGQKQLIITSPPTN